MIRRMSRVALLAILVGLPLRLGAQAPPELLHYQGRLVQGSNLVSGNVELSLRLFDAASGGTLLYEDSNTVAVADGLYATFLGDDTTYGALTSALATTNVHLEVLIDGTPLTPRERLASAAYALLADAVRPGGVTAAMLTDGAALAEIADDDGSGSGLNADSLDGYDASAFAGASHAHNAAAITSGTLDDARLSTNVSLLGASIAGAEIEDGAVSSADVNAASFSNTFWKTDGNAGTVTGAHFLGTTDGRPLELRVQGARAALFLPASPPILVFGAADNTIATNAIGAVIGGGSSNTIGSSAEAATIAGGRGNGMAVNADDSSIGGGSGNQIAGGANGSTIAGGGDNAVGPLSFYSAIGGGNGQDIATNCWYATIPGGFNNSVDSNAQYATVVGGNGNKAAGSYALAAGRSARAVHEGALVWADSSPATFSSTASNQVLFRARGGVGINTNAPQQALHVNGNAQADRFYFSNNAWLQLDASGTNLLFVANSVTNQLN